MSKPKSKTARKARPVVASSRVPLGKLTEISIRSRTESGDTPLHRAAKNGSIDEVPRSLLKVDLFLQGNSRLETPLHLAAKNGQLAKVPREFLTNETLSQFDYHGRAPLHIAASYGHADQIPTELLTLDLLRIRTQNFASNTFLHLVAETNTFHLIPSSCVKDELMELKNGYQLSPEEVLRANLPTVSQVTLLKELGVEFCLIGLTKARTEGLIEEALDSIKRRLHASSAETASLADSNTDSEKRETTLEYIKIDTTMHEQSGALLTGVTLLVKSTSNPNKSHQVSFASDGHSIRTSCSCQSRYRQSWMCKHQQALIDNDRSALVDSAQIALLDQIQSLPEMRHLTKSLRDHEERLRGYDDLIQSTWSELYALLRKAESVNQNYEGSIEELQKRLIDASRAAVSLKIAQFESLYRRLAQLQEERRDANIRFVQGLHLGASRTTP